MNSALSQVWAEVNDPRSTHHGALSAALLAGLTLVDPRRLGIGARVAYRAGLALLTGWLAWVATENDEGLLLPASARAGLAVGAAGVVLGAAEATEATDGWIHDRLTTAGVKRPRVLMAVAVAALSVGSWWLNRRELGAQQAPADEEELAAETIEVPGQVRELAALLLSQTDSFGAAELRAQLEAARAVSYSGPEPEGFWPGIGFQVPEELPLAVPGDANFPVIGRFRAIEDRTFDLYVSIQGGHLANLSVSEAADWSTEEHLAWLEAGRGVDELDGWPDPSELELLIETPAGPRPLA